MKTSVLDWVKDQVVIALLAFSTLVTPLIIVRVCLTPDKLSQTKKGRVLCLTRDNFVSKL